jgi:hypothetical protein
MATVRKSLLAIFAASTFSCTAYAADIPQSSACSVMGIVSGGGTYDRETLEENTIDADYNWKNGFGDGALGWICGNWNFQADAALHIFGGTDSPGTDTGRFLQRQSHFGGAIFARVPDQAAIGISASYIADSATLDVESPGGDFSLSGSGKTYRIGAFGEYFVNDQITLGASAHYLKGDVPSLLSPINVDISGVELGGLAKYYVNESLVFSGSLDMFRGKYLFGFIDAEFNGLSASLEGEYALPSTNFSLFAGGRWASRTLKDPSLAPATLNDGQLYAGFKFDFGSSKSSLAERDRTGTYDNTSLFAETLPSIGQSIVRGENQ